jgi:hypothetical protein
MEVSLPNKPIELTDRLPERRWSPRIDVDPPTFADPDTERELQISSGPRMRTAEDSCTESATDKDAPINVDPIVHWSLPRITACSTDILDIK